MTKGDLQIRAERDVLGPGGDLSPLVDPGDRHSEGPHQQCRDRPVGPRRRRLALSEHDEQNEEADLTQKLDALGKTREETALAERRDISKERGIRVYRGVEEDREEEDRYSESRQRRCRRRGHEEERGRQQDADRNERASPAEAGPDPI